MKDERDLIIVGGGIAGLSAGVYAQANGLKSEILEMHTVPGGLCTAWERKGFIFDYCIHWLIGSGKGHAFRKLWDFLGVLPGEGLVDHEIFQTWRTAGGQEVHWYTNADRLKKHFYEYAHPEDRRTIDELVFAIKKFSTFLLMEPDFSLSGVVRTMKSLPALTQLKKYAGVSWGDFVKDIKSPVLKEAFAGFFAMDGFPFTAVLFTLGHMHSHNAGYPLGASLGMAKRVAARYESLGGTISYASRVEEILVESGKAVGVRTKDGRVLRARHVFSAADAHATLYDMLGGRFVSPEWEKAFATMPPFPGPVQISFGVRYDEGSTPGSPRICGIDLLNSAATISMPLKRAFRLEDKDIKRVGFHHYAFDPSLGPEFGTPLTFLFGGDTLWWQKLASDREAYRTEKSRLADDLLDSLEVELPGFRQRVLSVDVATPVTNIRYTGNWQGSQEGFMITDMDTVLPSTISGLENFRLVGQWMHPGGGIPPSAKSGRDAIRALMKSENRRFTGA